MYVFVRFTGIVMLIFGLPIMLIGLGGAMVGIFFNDNLVELANTYLFANSRYVLPQQDMRFWTASYGLALFLLGMVSSALGASMLVLIDLVKSSKETNAILRSLRGKDL
jgi:hypothetical protein